MYINLMCVAARLRHIQRRDGKKNNNNKKQINK